MKFNIGSLFGLLLTVSTAARALPVAEANPPAALMGRDALLEKHSALPALEPEAEPLNTTATSGELTKRFLAGSMGPGTALDFGGWITSVGTMITNRATNVPALPNSLNGILDMASRLEQLVAGQASNADTFRMAVPGYPNFFLSGLQYQPGFTFQSIPVSLLLEMFQLALSTCQGTTSYGGQDNIITWILNDANGKSLFYFGVGD